MEVAGYVIEGHVPAREITRLAVALKQALLRLRNLLQDPAYNFFVESGLVDADQAAFLHWRLCLAPRVTVVGGFEKLASMAINPSLPEEDARLLRAALTA